MSGNFRFISLYIKYLTLFNNFYISILVRQFAAILSRYLINSLFLNKIGQNIFLYLEFFLIQQKTPKQCKKHAKRSIKREIIRFIYSNNIKFK